MKRQVSIMVLLILLVFTAMLAWYGLTKGHKWGDDFAAYIMQAVSVVRGTPSEFVAVNRFTIEKSMYPIGPVAYPWGFPVLLAPFYGLFGHNILALKIPGVICYLIFIVTLWFGFRRYHSVMWGTALACLFAFNPGFHSFMNNVISDIPFLLLSTLSVLMIGKVAIERQRILSTHADQLLLGVLIALSFFIRTNGILLLITLGVVHLTRIAKDGMSQSNTGANSPKRLRGIFFRLYRNVRKDVWMLLFPYICFATCVLAWQYVFPEGGSTYVSQFKGLTLSIVKDNVYFYAKSPLSFFATPTAPGAILAKLLFLTSIPLVVAGVFRRFGKDYHIVVYGALTLLLYVFWPYQDGRFISPLLPFYISFALTGLEGSVTASRRGWRSNILRALPVIFVILSFCWHSIAFAHKNLLEQRIEPAGPYVSTSQDVFSFISHHTDPNSIIVFFKPRAMRLFTGRQSIMTGKVEKLKRGDYLCIYLRDDAYDQLPYGAVTNFMEGGQVQLVYQNKDFQVFRIGDLINAYIE